MTDPDLSIVAPAAEAGRLPSDFGILVGRWMVNHQRACDPLAGRSEWNEFSGAASSQTLLDRVVSIDALSLADGQTGISLKLSGPDTEKWTIYWGDSRDGQLQPRLVGRWLDARFEAFGDEYTGLPIRAPYLWEDITDYSARWERAFSVDGGRTWGTNWVMAWSRIAAVWPV